MTGRSTPAGGIDVTVMPPKADQSQGGFASVRFLALLALFAFGLSLRAGCAGMSQIVSGYEQSAKKGLEAADDNTIQVWKAIACGTPLSAVLRNLDVIPALKALLQR